MPIEFLASDDVSPFVIDPGFEAGQTTATATGHLWWERGNPDGQDLMDVLLFLLAEFPLGSGRRVATGVPPLDELWGRIRFVGQDNAADPSQQNLLTDWQRFGATRPVVIPSLHAGCARYFEVVFDVPSHATETPYKLILDVQVSVHAVALAAGAADVDQGVLTGYGDGRHSGLIRGGEVTVSDPPDERVHVAARQVVIRGRGYGQIRSEILLDQVAADGVLEPGEAYIVALGLDEAGLVVVKGGRGVAPVVPDLAAGVIFLRWVTVDYQAGGVSVIGAEDLSGRTIYDRHALRAGSGLNVEVHAGTVVYGGTRRFWTGVEVVPVVGEATSFVWQLANGLYGVTVLEEAPEETAFLIGEVEADSVAVTAVRPRVRLAGRVERIVISGEVPSSPGLIGETTWLGERAWIDVAAMAVSDAGGGAGATVGDWRINWGSIYPGSGIDEQRPVVPVGAGQLFDDRGVAEVASVRRGDVVSFHTVAHPDTVPGWVEGILEVRW